jgi:hypothetical protein
VLLVKLHDICDDIALEAVDKEQWNTLLFLKLDDIQQQFAVAYKQHYLASTRQDDFDDVKSKIQAMSRVMKKIQRGSLQPGIAELRSRLKPEQCKRLGLDSLLEELINTYVNDKDYSDVLRQAEAEVDKKIENEQLLMETIEKVLLFYTQLVFANLYGLELPNKNTLEGARELLKDYKVSEVREHQKYVESLDNFIESHTDELVQAEDFKESGEGRATAANDWKMLDDDLEAGKITINEWQDRAKEIRAELRSFWLETPPMLSANLLSSALKNKTHTLNRALMVFDWPIDEDLIDSAASLMDITLLELLATRQKLKAIGIDEAEKSTAECQEYYSLSLELFSTCFDEGFFANFDQKIDPPDTSGMGFHSAFRLLSSKIVLQTAIADKKNKDFTLNLIEDSVAGELVPELHVIWHGSNYVSSIPLDVATCNKIVTSIKSRSDIEAGRLIPLSAKQMASICALLDTNGLQIWKKYRQCYTAQNNYLPRGFNRNSFTEAVAEKLEIFKQVLSSHLYFISILRQVMQKLPISGAAMKVTNDSILVLEDIKLKADHKQYLQQLFVIHDLANESLTAIYHKNYTLAERFKLDALEVLFGLRATVVEKIDCCDIEDATNTCCLPELRSLVYACSVDDRGHPFRLRTLYSDLNVALKCQQLTAYNGRLAEVMAHNLPSQITLSPALHSVTQSLLMLSGQYKHKRPVAISDAETVYKELVSALTLKANAR